MGVAQSVTSLFVPTSVLPAPAPAATTNGEIERGAMANAKQERRRRSDAGLSLGDMAKMRMAHDTVSKEHGK